MIRTLRFTTEQGTFGLPIANVRRIVSTAELGEMPEPRARVAGVLLEGQALIPVLDTLGASGELIIVMELDGAAAGVLVDDVAGVVSTSDELGPPPIGQLEALVSGTITVGRDTTMLIDPHVLFGPVLS
jgi:chemotaxis signal transduction protein